MLTNWLSLPLFGHRVSLADSFWLTCIFTVISLVRSYALRRFFNRLHGRRIETEA